jgi:hypothetical protein
VWLGDTAIPPIPAYARVRARALHDASRELAAGPSGVTLANHFSRFEHSQPTVAERLTRRLGQSVHEGLREVGVTLAVALWIAFERTAVHGLDGVRPEDWNHAKQLLRTDEEIRRRNPNTVMESDDVIAAQQPDAAAFVRKRLDEVLRAYADEIDVDDVDKVYELMLIEVLALSYAVRAPTQGTPPPVPPS